MINKKMGGENSENLVKLLNPLGEEFMYFRQELTPGLLKVAEDHKKVESLMLFEIANVYLKNKKDLPLQIPHFAGILKGKSYNFYHAKGVIEQICLDIGINYVRFSENDRDAFIVLITLKKEIVGEINVIDKGLVLFEMNFELLLKHATSKKTFTPLAKYPPIIEDLTVIIQQGMTTGDISLLIKKQHVLIKDVSLIDKYEKFASVHFMFVNPQSLMLRELE